VEKLEYLLTEKAKKYISSLTPKHQARLKGHIDLLAEQQYDFIETKPLRGKVREILVGGYRAIYFTIENVIFVVDIFKKSTQKTPPKRIEHAEKLYRSVLNDK
jgi:phage-related protein